MPIPESGTPIATPTPVEGAGAATPQSISTTTPTPGAAPITPAAGAFSIPKDYAEKPYLKGIDSADKVFKLLDDAQGLIGKRPAGIPQDTAPKEEWDKFYAAKGRPEKPEDYEIKVPDALKPHANPEFEKEMRTGLFEAGLSKKEAGIVVEKYHAALTKLAEAQAKKDADMNTEFDVLVSKQFGDADKTAKAVETTKAMVAKFASPEMAAHLKTMDNKSLLMLTTVLDKVRAEFIDDDQLPGGGSGMGGLSVDQRREEAKKIMATPEYTNQMHPGHAAAAQRVKDLYSDIK